MKAGVRFATLAALLSVARPAAAQTALPLTRAAEPTRPAITPADLMTRLYLYADDSMMGRGAGTEYNLKATAYIGEEARRLGLVPAGDGGTYFQSVPLVRRGFDEGSRLVVDGVTLRPWQDYLPRDQGRPTRSFDGAQAVFAGAWGDSVMLPADQGAGKLVVIGVPRRPNPQQPAWFVPRAGAIGRYRGAAGIAIVSLDLMPPQLRQVFRDAQVTLKDAAAPPPPPPGRSLADLPLCVRRRGAAAPRRIRG